MKTVQATALLAAAVCCQSAFGQDLKADLWHFAAQASKEGKVRLRKPSFDTAGVNLRYDLGGWSSVEPDPDNPEPMDLVLRAALQAQVIRDDDSDISKKWLAPVLDQVRDIIGDMAADLGKSDLSRKQLLDSLTTKADRIDRIYAKQMEMAAKRMGKREADAIRAAKEYHVKQVITVPDGGTIKCMPAGRWELYKFRFASTKGLAEPEWTTLVQTTDVTLVGRYRFRVTWPKGDPFEGEVEVNSNSPLTFRQP